MKVGFVFGFGKITKGSVWFITWKITRTKNVIGIKLRAVCSIYSKIITRVINAICE